MNLLSKSLVLSVITLVMAAQTKAATADYVFSATHVSGTDFGATMTGAITLDLNPLTGGAGPYPGYNGEFGYWSDNAFSINVITSSGYQSGTSLGGGRTEFFIQDFPIDSTFGINAMGISWMRINADGHTAVGVNLTIRDSAVGDGIAVIPNPWQPMDWPQQELYVWDYDYDTGTGHWGYYTLTTFSVLPKTILIDGLDTGISDFTFQGTLVSTQIANFAAAATNHGSFVSNVNVLANKLKKAGLLTDTQRTSLSNFAASSKVGK